MLKDILKIGSEHLTKPTSKVEEINDDVRSKLARMWEILDGTKGMALAANQVGFSESMFVMKGTDETRLEIINPKIVMISSNTIGINEGCLSLPGPKVKTKRSQELVLEFQTIDGEIKFGTFSDMDAVCVQHEMEHLKGENFLQHASRKDRRQIERKYL